MSQTEYTHNSVSAYSPTIGEAVRAVWEKRTPLALVDPQLSWQRDANLDLSTASFASLDRKPVFVEGKRYTRSIKRLNQMLSVRLPAAGLNVDSQERVQRLLVELSEDFFRGCAEQDSRFETYHTRLYCPGVQESLDGLWHFDGGVKTRHKGVRLVVTLDVEVNDSSTTGGTFTILPIHVPNGVTSQLTDLYSTKIRTPAEFAENRGDVNHVVEDWLGAKGSSIQIEDIQPGIVGIFEEGIGIGPLHRALREDESSFRIVYSIFASTGRRFYAKR